jgi:hypothetical protein
MELLSKLRLGLLVVLGLGMTGTVTDLLLISHYEDAWQIVPIGLIATALAAILWSALRPGAASLRAVRATMVLLMVSGAAGVLLHFNGAAGFQLEIDPAQARWTVFTKAIRVHSPPVLAPGVMVQLGLIGLLYSYRHPAAARTDREGSQS